MYLCQYPVKAWFNHDKSFHPSRINFKTRQKTIGKFGTEGWGNNIYSGESNSAGGLSVVASARESVMNSTKKTPPRNPARMLSGGSSKKRKIRGRRHVWRRGSYQILSAQIGREGATGHGNAYPAHPERRPTGPPVEPGAG